MTGKGLFCSRSTLLLEMGIASVNQLLTSTLKRSWCRAVSVGACLLRLKVNEDDVMMVAINVDDTLVAGNKKS